MSLNTDSTAPAKMYVGDTANIVVDSDVVLPPEMAKAGHAQGEQGRHVPHGCE